MEISFRFNETDGPVTTIQVPVGGTLTMTVKPVGGPAQPVGGDGGRLNVNGANAHPPGGMNPKPLIYL